MLCSMQFYPILALFMLQGVCFRVAYCPVGYNRLSAVVRKRTSTIASLVTITHLSSDTNADIRVTLIEKTRLCSFFKEINLSIY